MFSLFSKKICLELAEQEILLSSSEWSVLYQISILYFSILGKIIRVSIFCCGNIISVFNNVNIAAYIIMPVTILYNNSFHIKIWEN